MALKLEPHEITAIEQIIDSAPFKKVLAARYETIEKSLDELRRVFFQDSAIDKDAYYVRRDLLDAEKSAVTEFEATLVRIVEWAKADALQKEKERENKFLN